MIPSLEARCRRDIHLPVSGVLLSTPMAVTLTATTLLWNPELPTWLFRTLDILALIVFIISGLALYGSVEDEEDVGRSLFAFSLFAGWNLAYCWSSVYLFVHIALALVIGGVCYVLLIPTKKPLAFPEGARRASVAVSVFLVNLLVFGSILLAWYVPPFSSHRMSNEPTWTLGALLPWLRIILWVLWGLAVITWSAEYTQRISQRLGGRVYAGFLFAVVALWVGIAFVVSTPSAQPVRLDALAEQVRLGAVQRIVITGNRITVWTTGGEQLTAVKEDGIGGLETLRDLGVSQQHLQGVEIEIEEPGFLERLGSSTSIAAIVAIAGLVLGLVILVVLVLGMRRFAGLDFGLGDKKFTESRHRTITSERPHVRFDDVGGTEEAKAVLRDIAEFLKSPDRFTRLGAGAPKGVLLEGLPGTGKTLLARAVAGEASVPMFVANGSEFTELFVGVGAARIRDIFERAKEEAPPLIFIDELDAIGHRRGTAVIQSAQLEYDQTLNQLLAELDGFDPRTEVVVIGATNRSDILDPALLRPGRFDKRIRIDLPDENERQHILQIHAREKPLAANVDLKEIAAYTAGMTGAELAAIANEAALLASKRGRIVIEDEDFEQAARSVGAVIPEMQKPREIAAVLDETVIGQEAAKRVLAASVCHHYNRVRASSDSAQGKPTKPNVLLHGPPGTGKSLLVRTLAGHLQVPFATFDAASLVQNADSIRIALNRLLIAADTDKRRAECGIVCIYGIESFVAGSLANLARVSTQEELARILEGVTIEVPQDMYSISSETTVLDTSRILFICEGTFDGLEESVIGRLGFGNGSLEIDNPLRLVTQEDLVTYGFEPQLASSFPIVVATDPLSEQDLVKILSEPEGSLIKQYERRFKGVGVDLRFEESALTEIAKESLSRGGGARTLTSVLEEVLLDSFYDSEHLGAQFVVNARVVADVLERKAVATGTAAKLYNGSQEPIQTTTAKANSRRKQ